MVEPAKNSIWIYLIPLWQVEQVSSTFGRRGVEVSLTSHYGKNWNTESEISSSVSAFSAL